MDDTSSAGLVAVSVGVLEGGAERGAFGVAVSCCGTRLVALDSLVASSTREGGMPCVLGLGESAAPESVD